ncbi:MAG: 6,7-dimethyl-8-ribityllumazine synthase [Chitinophagales bacterium]
MASNLKNLSDYNAEEIPSGKGKKIGIVVSEWNNDITFALHEGCVETLSKHGVADKDIFTKVVPGSFELPFAAKAILVEEKVDAVICIGCVIKGETDHDIYINQSVASAIMQLGLMTDKPFIFGVLTPNTHEQAKDRAGGKHGNKGVEAAITALRMIHIKKEQRKSMGFK